LLHRGGVVFAVAQAAGCTEPVLDDGHSRHVGLQAIHDAVRGQSGGVGLE
jgi:hypothetical protein